MKRLILLAIISVALGAYAQNWSAPVQLTNDWGDDHDLDIQYNWADNSWWAAWTHTDSVNSEIYHAFFDPQTVAFDQVRRLTYRPEADEKPSIAHGMMDHSGVFFQSFHEGRRAIYFVVENDTGFSAPWLTLYSDANLYEPDYSPIETDFGGFTIPALFLRSDSAVLAFDYAYVGGEWNFEVPRDTAFYVAVENSGHPVLSHDGRWANSPVVGFHWQQFAWEKEVSGQGEIEYYYQIMPESTLWIETYTGFIPNDNYSYHNPLLGMGWYGTMYLERESETAGTDLAVTYFDRELAGWNMPDSPFDMPGNERNPDEDWGSVVFENDYYGNWNIAFWNGMMSQPEFVDTTAHDDVDPIVRIINNQYFVFWESQRTGSSKIYCSSKLVLGIVHKSPPTPGKFALSVHPNPGNAEFRIELELPVSGEVEAAIYDLSGRRVAMIQDGWMTMGLHDLTWNARGFPSGIYLMQVESGKYHQARKLVLLK